MYEKLLVGTAYWEFARAALDTALIWGVFFLLHFTLAKFIPIPKCVETCFIPTCESNCAAIDQTPCCVTHWIIVSQAIGFLVIVFVGGYVSTKYTRRKKLRHSTTVTAFLIISTLIPLWYWKFSFSTLLLSVIAIFLSSFQGYKLWFTLKERAQS